MSIADLRKEYTRAGLSERRVDADALIQFRAWFDAAVAVGVAEPNAMTLATATAGGEPAARIVLLKGVDMRGLVFYTNYQSAKGRQLEANPRATLLFFWPELERQIRISGKVARVSREESLAYFHSRPRGSQLGAWVSRQSRAIPGRAALDKRLALYQARFEGKVVPLPSYWGGYVLNPRTVEFWQGRPNRLHDRILYTRTTAGWKISRLAP